MSTQTQKAFNMLGNILITEDLSRFHHYSERKKTPWFIDTVTYQDVQLFLKCDKRLMDRFVVVSNKKYDYTHKDFPVFMKNNLESLKIQNKDYTYSLCGDAIWCGLNAR